MAETKRRVLVVDDEPSILKIVATRLQWAGFEVVIAMDGQAALMKVLEEPIPDLVNRMIGALNRDNGSAGSNGGLGAAPAGPPGAET